MSGKGGEGEVNMWTVKDGGMWTGEGARGGGQGMWIVDSKGKGVDCWRRRGWSSLSRQVPVHMN